MGKDKYRNSFRRPAAGRGFQEKDSVLHGKESLEDMKLKRELQKMMLEDHFAKLKAELPKEEAEEMVIRWMDDTGKEWTTRG